MMDIRSQILAALGSSSEEGEKSRALSRYLEALVLEQGYPRARLAEALEELRRELQLDGRGADEFLVSFEIRRWKPPPDVENVAHSPLTAEELVANVLQSDLTEERLFSVAYWLVHGRGMERDAVVDLLRNTPSRLNNDLSSDDIDVVANVMTDVAGAGGIRGWV